MPSTHFQASTGLDGSDTGLIVAKGSSAAGAAWKTGRDRGFMMVFMREIMGSSSSNQLRHDSSSSDLASASCAWVVEGHVMAVDIEPRPRVEGMLRIVRFCIRIIAHARLYNYIISTL